MTNPNIHYVRANKGKNYVQTKNGIIVTSNNRYLKSPRIWVASGKGNVVRSYIVRGSNGNLKRVVMARK